MDAAVDWKVRFVDVLLDLRFCCKDSAPFKVGPENGPFTNGVTWVYVAPINFRKWMGNWGDIAPW